MTAVIRKPRRTLSPWWLLALVPVVIGALLLAGVIRWPFAAQTSSTTKLETATATQGTFTVAVSASGTLQATDTRKLRPEVNGIIQKLPAIGDRVTKGQLLVMLEQAPFVRDVTTAKLALEKAQAQLASQQSSQTSSAAAQQQTIQSAETSYTNAQIELQTARTTLESQQRLFAVGGVSAQSVSDAQSAEKRASANLENARTSLETARQTLTLKQNSGAQDLKNLELAVSQARITWQNALENQAKSKLYAPVSGTIAAVGASVGDTSTNLATGNALITLVNDDEVDLPAQVDETQIGSVKLGQRAEVTLDAFPGRTFAGSVRAITPQATISNNIAIFYVYLRIKNPTHELKSGMTAEAEIVSQQLENAVLIPKRAVQTVSTRDYVTVLGEDGQTEERRWVTLGPDDGVNAVVQSGLKAGETVIVSAQGSSSTTQTGSSTRRNNSSGQQGGIPMGGPGGPP